tara:strand:+ start:6213 stop:7592 length:1380 start_codon:yes stop_codon:yes gene_type:complete
MINFYKTYKVFCNILFSTTLLYFFYNFKFPGLDLILSDSDSFLNKSYYRTPGYPFFLSIIKFFNYDLTNLPIIQQLICIFSGAICFQILNSVKKSPLTWSAFGIFSIGNPLIWKYSNFILSESLYISFSLLFLGILIKGITKKSSFNLYLSSLILGILVLIKPVAYAFVASSTLIFIIKFKFNKSILYLFPCFLILFTTSSFNYFKNGFFATQIFGGYNIVGQVSNLIKPSNKKENYLIKDKIEKKLEFINKKVPYPPYSNWKDYYWKTTLTYNYSLWKIIEPEIDEYIINKNLDINEVDKIKEINKLCWEISFDAIIDNPFNYIQSVLIHFKSMWIMPFLNKKDELTIVQREIESFKNKDIYIPSILNHSYPNYIINFKNLVMLSLLISSLFFLLKLLLNSKNPLFLIGGLSSILINSNHLLVSLVEPAIPRYIMVIIPFLAIIVAILTIIAKDKTAN